LILSKKVGRNRMVNLSSQTKIKKAANAAFFIFAVIIELHSNFFQRKSRCRVLSEAKKKKGIPPGAG